MEVLRGRGRRRRLAPRLPERAEGEELRVGVRLVPVVVVAVDDGHAFFTGIGHVACNQKLGD